MRRRKSEEKRTPRITHDQVVELLVDYHLGRLSTGVNRAIEAHVVHCPLCQMQNLNHTATEKRAIQRHIGKVKPKRRRLISRRGQIIILILALLLLIQGGLYIVTRTNLLRPEHPALVPTETTAPTATLSPMATATHQATVTAQPTQSKAAIQPTATPHKTATPTPTDTTPTTP